MNMLIRHGEPIFKDAHKVTLFQFSRGDRVEHKHAVFNWLSTTDAGYWFQRSDDNLPPEFYSFEEISRAFDQEQRDPMGYLPARRQAKSDVAPGGTELLSNLLPPELEGILFKHAWCLRFLAAERVDDILSRSDKKMDDYIQKTQTQLQEVSDTAHKEAGRTHRTAPRLRAAPGARTLRRWLQQLENANFDPIALNNNSSARYRRDHFTADELEHIDKHVMMYATKARLPIKELYRLLKEAIEADNQQRQEKNQRLGADVLAKLRVPNIDTFSARISKLPRSLVDRGRRGKEFAEAKYHATVNGVDAIQPLERVEIDESWVDLSTILILADDLKRLSPKERSVVERVRLYITAVIDVASKNLLAARIHHSPPNAASAVAALEMMTRDKTELSRSLGCETAWNMEGLPMEVSLDSATWNASAEVRIAVNDIGAILFQPKAGDAAARGTLERYFRTMNRDALLHFTGRTWGSTDEKGSDEPEKEASVAFDQAAHLLYRWLVDVYPNTPHHGLNDEKPRDAWARLRKFHKPTPPLSARFRRSVFGIKMRRKVSAAGIRIMGIQYTSTALQNLFQDSAEEFDVRLDRFDLGAISIRHEQGWLDVPAAHEEFVGMSLWKWLAFNDRLRLTNRKTADVDLDTARRTKEWLRQQAQVLAAEAELGSAVLTERDILRFEKNIAYQVNILEQTRNRETPEFEEADITSLINDWDLHGIAQRAETKQQVQGVAAPQPPSRKKNVLNPAFNR